MRTVTSRVATMGCRGLLTDGISLHGRFEVLDEIEEDVDVDGFWDEGEVAGGEGALAVFFTRITGDGDGRNVVETGQDAQLFEKLVTVDFRHADVRNDDVRTLIDSACQCF